MVDPSPAVKPAARGVALDVEVVPGASDSRFPAGFNPWRNRLEARVRAPPEKGQANQELASLVAHFFRVPASAAEVTSGHTSRRKTVTVTGITRDEALARLREALP